MAEVAFVVSINGREYAISEIVLDDFYGLARIYAEGDEFLIGTEEMFRDAVLREWDGMDEWDILEVVGEREVARMWSSGMLFETYVSDVADEYYVHLGSYDGIRRWFDDEELDYKDFADYLGFEPEVALRQ